MTTTAERFELSGHSTEPIWAGWARGAYTLPDGIIAHGRAYNALVAAAAEANAANTAAKAADGAPGRLAAVNATIAHAIATATLPADPAGPIVAAHKAAEDAALRLDVLREAGKRMSDSLTTAIVTDADELVTAHWRPAFAETLAAVAAIAPDLAGVDVTSTASVSAHGAKAAAAFVALADARTRVDAILAAVECLAARCHRGQKDAARLFADCKSFPTGPTAGREPNGPRDGLARLLWLATDPGADPWLGTLDELDTRSDDWTFRDPKVAGNRYAAQEAAARTAEHERLRAEFIAGRTRAG